MQRCDHIFSRPINNAIVYYQHQSSVAQTVGKPGKYWYTQMGAWEVQNSSTTINSTTTRDGVLVDQALRQVSTVWPNCWNSQDCDPPKVWFGPALYNDQDQAGSSNGVVASFDLFLEEQGNVSLSLAPFNALQAKPAAGGLNAQPPGTVTLCTNGTWVVGSKIGSEGLNLTVGAWHKVSVGRS